MVEPRTMLLLAAPRGAVKGISGGEKLAGSLHCYPPCFTADYLGTDQLRANLSSPRTSIFLPSTAEVCHISVLAVVPLRRQVGEGQFPLFSHGQAKVL